MARMAQTQWRAWLTREAPRPTARRPFVIASELPAAPTRPAEARRAKEEASAEAGSERGNLQALGIGSAVATRAMADESLRTP